MQYQLEQGFHQAGAENLRNRVTRFFFAIAGLWVATARGADAPQASVAHWIESRGGQVVSGPDGNIVEISLARTWATNNDIERVVEIKGLKRLICRSEEHTSELQSQFHL